MLSPNCRYTKQTFNAVLTKCQYKTREAYPKGSPKTEGSVANQVLLSWKQSCSKANKTNLSMSNSWGKMPKKNKLHNSIQSELPNNKKKKKLERNAHTTVWHNTKRVQKTN